MGFTDSEVELEGKDAGSRTYEAFVWNSRRGPFCLGRATRCHLIIG